MGPSGASSLTAPLLISLGVGAVLGLLIIIAFQIQTKTGATTLSKSFFGIPPVLLLNNLMITLLVIAFIVLSAMSFVIRDVGYLLAHPLAFTGELLLMAVIPAALFLGLWWFRAGRLDPSAIPWFLGMCLKFGISHLLFQFSGYYTGFYGV